MLLTIAFLCSGVFNTNKNTAQAVAQNKCQAEYARPATEEEVKVWNSYGAEIVSGQPVWFGSEFQENNPGHVYNTIQWFGADCKEQMQMEQQS